MSLNLYGIKNKVTRQYMRLEAASSDDARRLTGWSPAEILYTMQLTVSKPQMGEDVKARLRNLAALRRSVRGPNAEGRGDGSKEGRVMAKKENKNGKIQIVLFGHPVSAVIRWMGKDKFSCAEAIAALKAQNLHHMPTSSTVSWALKNKEGAEAADLTAEQQKRLRDAAKAVEAEEKPAPKAKVKTLPKENGKGKASASKELKHSKAKQVASKPKRKLSDVAADLEAKTGK